VLLSVCTVVACGHLRRILDGVNALIDLATEQRRATVRRYAADHNYDE
jgi:hypothetical protein